MLGTGCFLTAHLSKSVWPGWPLGLPERKRPHSNDHLGQGVRSVSGSGCQGENTWRGKMVLVLGGVGWPPQLPPRQQAPPHLSFLAPQISGVPASERRVESPSVLSCLPTLKSGLLSSICISVHRLPTAGGEHPEAKVMSKQLLLACFLGSQVLCPL